MGKIASLFMLLACAWCISADLDYYRGNDFATLTPLAADSFDASGNFGDGFAAILDRPTLEFDPAQNSFEQRLVMKFRKPDFKKELEHRLLHKATLQMVFKGEKPMAFPEIALYYAVGDNPQLMAADAMVSERLRTVPAGKEEVKPGDTVTFDVTEAFRKAKKGKIITLAFSISKADARVELPFAEQPAVELTLAQQVHGMRNGKKLPGTVICDMTDVDQWNVELSGAPENGAVKMEATSEFTFTGKPAMKFTCDNLDGNSKITLTPKKPVPLAPKAAMLEIWSWGGTFTYAIQRTLAVTIVDADGNEISRDLAMKLGTRGTQAHPCDFRAPFDKFDDTKDYWLKEITIRNFTGTAAHDYFGLGPVATYPLGKAPLATDSFTVKIPTDEIGMVPRVQADKQTVTEKDGTYYFKAASASGTVTYAYTPKTGTFDDFSVSCGDETFAPMTGGGIIHAPNGARETVTKGELLKKHYDKASKELTVQWSDEKRPDASSTWTIRLVNRSLVIDITSTNPVAGGVSMGALTGMKNPELIKIPYFSFHGLKNGQLGPGVVHSNGIFFYGGLDFYSSDASDFYAEFKQKDGKTFYNGGSWYMFMTDFTKVPLRDRIFLTASPVLSEILPQTPTPDMHKREKARDYFYMQMNCPNMEQYEHFTNMGMNNLFYTVFWSSAPSDNAVDRMVRKAHGDSVSFSYQAAYDMEPAPELFRDFTPREFVDKVRADGNLFGIYVYYTDSDCHLFNYDPRDLARNIYVQPQMGCLGSCRLKPCCMPEYERQISVKLKKYWGDLDGVYSDVITCRCFWGGTVDQEPGYPLSGKNHIAATAQLIKQEQEFGNGLVYSEGTFQWLYAGMTSGSYGTILTNHPEGPSMLPMLPEFQARCSAPRSVLVGMCPNAYGFVARGKNPMVNGVFHNTGVRQYYAALLGYGNAALAVAWDVSYMTMHGVAKLWYLFAPIHPLYLLQPVEVIEYFDGSQFLETSKAITSKAYLDGKLRKTYQNGTLVYVNYNNDADWAIQTPDGRNVTLPPWGFYVVSKDGKTVSASLRARDGNIIDYSVKPDQIYLDAWDAPQEIPGLAIKGAGAVRKTADDTLVFYPLGVVPKNGTRADEGVEEAVIDLAYFMPGCKGEAIVEGKSHDGTWHTVTAEADGTRLTLHPSDNLCQYKISVK